MTEITDFRRMAHGVGGSYTRWQGKPPAHSVFWVETGEGQTTIKAYDVRDHPLRDDGAVIDDDPMGPKDIPFKSGVPFSDFSEELQEAIRQRAIGFWDEKDSD